MALVENAENQLQQVAVQFAQKGFTMVMQGVMGSPGAGMGVVQKAMHGFRDALNQVGTQGGKGSQTLMTRPLAGGRGGLRVDDARAFQDVSSQLRADGISFTAQVNGRSTDFTLKGADPRSVANSLDKALSKVNARGARNACRQRAAGQIRDRVAHKKGVGAPAQTLNRSFKATPVRGMR